MKKIKGGLIVSCQALEEEPLHSSYIMSKMAMAAVEGGACGIRANSIKDIIEIKKTVDVPIIGIIKKVYSDNSVFITPTFKEVEELVKVGVDIIAMDGTKRTRPDGVSLCDLVRKIKEKYPKQKIMADVSTVEEAVFCENLGFDFIGTTLVGYTEYTKENNPLEVLQEILARVKAKVIAEGNMNTPAHVKKAYELGVYSVVVGSMITRPTLITKKFVEAVNKFNFSKSNKYFAFDIGGTGVKYALANSLGEMIFKDQFPTNNYKSFKDLCNRLFTLLEDYKEEIAGIGISCTGKIDVKTGIITGGVEIMEGWLGASLKKNFEDKYNLPVYVNNDVKCVALSELYTGIGVKYNNFICVAIGTGIGGAIVDGGKLICGENNFAGEIGHTILEFNGKDCKCGKKGCFEMYGSMSALVREVQKATGKIYNGKEIFDKVKNNEKIFVDIVNVWINNIGKGIANLVLLLNPKVIVLGGAVSVQKELFLDKVEIAVKNYLTVEHSRGLEFISATNFNDAGMIGAVYGVMNLI